MKAILARSRQIAQIKKYQMVGQFPRKENSLVRHFSNHLIREMLNTKGENPD